MEQRIVCAANRYTNTTHEPIIVTGVRHWCPVMRAVILANHQITPSSHEEQGFVDNRYNFLTREDAWVVAEKAGQIIRRVGGDTINGGKLFSENLY